MFRKQSLADERLPVTGIGTAANAVRLIKSTAVKTFDGLAVQAETLDEFRFNFDQALICTPV
jgi:hypothetical protein